MEGLGSVVGFRRWEGSSAGTAPRSGTPRRTGQSLGFIGWDSTWFWTAPALEGVSILGSVA